MAEVERRLGMDWCVEHGTPVAFCCSAEDGNPAPAPQHQWGGYNALRRYTGLMIKGSLHPFRKAGGPMKGVSEGDEALQAALSSAATVKVPIETLVATGPITPAHIGLMLRGKAPGPRTGNTPFESEALPTVVRVGKQNVLADGHHRATSAWARGETHLKARVVSGVTPVFENSNSLLISPE